MPNTTVALERSCQAVRQIQPDSHNSSIGHLRDESVAWFQEGLDTEDLREASELLAGIGEALL